MSRKGQLVEYLRDDDYQKFIKELADKPVMKNLIIIATKVGLRVSDLLSITFEMIQDNKVKLNEKKTGKLREITLNKTALEAVRELSEYYEKLGYTKDTGFLFKSMNRAYVKNLTDKAVTDRAINKELDRLQDYFNLPYEVGTHSLRKKFGRDIYHATNDIAIVMKVLNHSSQSVTLAYIGIEKQIIEDVYNLI